MSSYSLVGTAGGAGTTRLALELGGVLARGGWEVTVLDASYATQGLADHCSGRIDPDATTLALDGDIPLSAGLVDLAPDAPGRLAVCPARAPFERLARAKAPEAARRLEARIEAASEAFDVVLVDTPPVAANQSVAAAVATDERVLVAPPGQRGRDALARTRDRLADLGVEGEHVLVNRTDSLDGAPDADAVVPASSVTDPAEVPVTLDGEGTFVARCAEAAATLFDADLEIETEAPGLGERLRSLG
ncbi:ParA family protein [Halomarina ordinaria]|uniref:ParA family protein n=1 Tax=Halomarina ordinaria TaxID=3033939 RepID=A0ABD5U9J3_9EURY|nr:ParA family protein [Halomarina sp. PSRA2]